MKLLLTLATDAGQFITQVEVLLPEHDLGLPATEFSFKNMLLSKAIETLQAEGRLEIAAKRYGGKLCQFSSEVH